MPSIIVSGSATRRLVSGGSSLAGSACRAAGCALSPVIGAGGPCAAAAAAAILAASVPSSARPSRTGAGLGTGAPLAGMCCMALEGNMQENTD